MLRSDARQLRIYFSTFLVIAAIVSATPVVHAQSVEDQLKDLRMEVQRLRDELLSVKDEIRTLKTQPQLIRVASTAIDEVIGSSVPAQPQTSEAAQQEIPVQEALTLLQEQVREHARSKVESNSKFPMKLFGTIVSNTFYNTGEPNWLDLGNVVMPVPTGLPTGSFSSSLRQTRFGAIVDGPSAGSMKTSGFMAFDFFGGIPNFQTGQVFGLPRLLYAYFRVENSKTALLVGQDHVILAPRNPTSLTGMSFPILFRAGNLYLRAPQIRLEQTLLSGRHGEFRAVGGVLAPVAGDNPTTAYAFVPPNLAGERSRRPAVQARLFVRQKPAGPYEEPTWEFGASGHYSKERYLTGLIPSWASSVDFDLTVGRFGTGGEFFKGRNIDAFGASLAQNAKSKGGFVEGRFSATSQWDFNAGYGTDRLYDRVRFPGNLTKNASVFANSIFRVTPEFAFSLEWRKLETSPLTGRLRRNNHFDLTFAYSF